MKPTILLTTLLAIFMLTVAAPAGAQSTLDECKAGIDLIQTDLDGIFASGGIGGNNPQQTHWSLTSKLQSARTRLDQHKSADALQKLQDFRTAVISMRDAAKPKLSAADAGLLLDGVSGDTGVNGAIACVALLP